MKKCDRRVTDLLRIMKLTTLFLLLGMMTVSAEGYSQKRLTVLVNNGTLNDLFNQIQQQSDYLIFYRDEVLAGNRLEKINLELKNKKIGDILDRALKGTHLTYRISGRQIAVIEDIPENRELIQQEVSGTVQDTSGMPLPGVSVQVKGTTTGTMTDIEGRFTLPAGPEDVLVISLMGFLSKEVPVGGQDELTINLQEDVARLEQVVVVGYGTQKRSSITGAVTAVDAADLNNMAASNLSNTLAGRAPGVNVTNTSGLSGASSRIRIRGSFGEPLYVIDGIVRDKAAFDALEASEVNQMSFLKDAATASIYGSRAGNGVVLVTTKKGKAQEATFNFQSNYTMGRPTMTLLSDLTTATDELIYQNRVAEFNGNAAPNGTEEFEYFENRSYNVHDFIWRNPSFHRQSLSVTGGNEKVTYYSLLSYRDEQGSYTSVDHQKYNLRSNISANITDAVSVDLNLSANQQNLDRFYWPFTGDDDYDVSDLYRVTFNWPKTYPFYLEEDGTPADYVTDYPVQTPMGSWQAWSVIDQVIGDRYIQTRRRQLNSILTLNVKLDALTPGLSTKVTGSYLAEDYMRKKYLTYQTNYVFNQADPGGNRFLPAPPDPNDINIFTFSQNQPFMSYDMATYWGYQFNWFLNYDRTFNKHTVQALAVFEQAESGGHEVLARAENPITSDDQMFVYPTDRQFRYGDGRDTIGARQSYIGRVHYAYDDKYIAEFSFRYDGNTLFPDGKRWGFFPSVSAAWRIAEEPFFRELTGAFDELKLRASYGTTGNDLNVSNEEIAAFAYAENYVNSGNYIFGDRLYQQIAPGATPNPFLTWATSTTYNLGLDVAVMNGKLSGTLDAFVREETDILGPRGVTLPVAYGRALAPENYAARSWRGGELTVMWQDDIGNGLNYAVTGNLGYARDRWDTYDENPAYAPGGNQHFQSRIGRPEDRIIGLRALGIIRTQEQLDALLEQGFTQYGRDPYLGGLYFEDVRGDGYSPGPDGKIDGNDFQLLSDDAAPRINYGFGFDVYYKRFALQAHFQGVMAYDRIISNQEGAGMRQHGGAVRPYYPIWASDVWTPDNPDAKYPRPIGQNWYESGTGSTSFWIRNGAYLRLKTLNLSYSLPEAWSSTLKLKDITVYFNGTNLFFISEMDEFHDPEQRNYDSYPIMKTFTFGLDVRF
ncbi:TonB-linked SusC/RagA family outer membrane protein [Anseongella ginsenosidimutans]|uniref:TonB-linked SusC/RagA family outer membrane protein n=2 Tax=Anseongella ginsenosidimutans TaxID=496056 RepID=A0A4V6NZ28_9SPHI|nr:TonB-dependent receptor [Anseongella ginsenosidimutans]TCS86732.1 TonB-linked SusC/RagA family outer membrane protein [Anseongella ginsenosidimutans]